MVTGEVANGMFVPPITEAYGVSGRLHLALPSRVSTEEMHGWARQGRDSRTHGRTL